MIYSVISRIGHVLKLVLIASACSVEGLMILRIPHAIRLQCTRVAATTRRKSLGYSMNALSLRSLTMIRKQEELYGEGVCSEKASTGDSDVQQLKFGPKASKPGFLRERFPEFSWHLLPNWLTYCRCAAIPMLIVFFYSSHRPIIPCGIFTLASMTDYLDGYLARKWDISSDFGAFLDPVVSEYK